MRWLPRLSPALAFALMLVSGLTMAMDASRQLEAEVMRRWIDAMKVAPRGPFERIRWFCVDGSVLPPGEGVCRERGGGVQHGEWSTRTLAIRNQGYLVATLLADLQPADFIGPDARLDDLRQLLLEQFLIQADDGWVFRQARYYRGALQVEDERAGAQQLLLALVGDGAWRDPPRYLLLREAARLLPITAEPPAAALVRQLAIEIVERDPGFQSLRLKLHSIPDAKDPQRVRDYAASKGRPALADSYARLVHELEALYAPQTAERRLEYLESVTNHRVLRATLREALTQLRTTDDLQQRLHIAAEFARRWRTLFFTVTEMAPPNRLRLLQAGLAMEDEIYALGSRLIEETTGADRLTRLHWLRSLAVALFAGGLLSERQMDALEQRLGALATLEVLSGEAYFAELRYLARCAQWAQRALEFHFGPTVERWSELTPLAAHFMPDRLRGSPLLTYSRILDVLLQDAHALVGVRQHLFEQEVTSGLRGINPGLRRGVLLAPPDDAAAFRRDGIYLLPATTPQLPPVAGILSRGEGSSLSHVQLLARNLGIPTVEVDDALLPHIEARFGSRVVLAVSPRGTVRISADGPHWDAVFGREAPADDVVIAPDLNKLDLKTTALRPLHQLRAGDSGRSVGPKAANLGELLHRYPQFVNSGVVIPFGMFRTLLDRPVAPGGPAMYDWLQTEYTRLHAIAEPEQRQAETRLMLEQLRHWIVSTDPGADFRARLRAALEASFGTADGVAVFVRSDTNVEDLPGFTGAGLNLTVPNVVGFEAIVQAIQRVWASPFTERAYAWRQAHMAQPEHVYPAVLLLETFAAEKSGVLVTVDVDNGDRRWLSIAANEGVGGVVDGQAAEELRVSRADGEVHLLAQASAPRRAEPAPRGGIRKVPASGRDTLLTPAEIEQLRRLAHDVERRLPLPLAADGRPAPADIEFGFRDGRLALFQIRPFVESRHARRSQYLIEMDRSLIGAEDTAVDLRKAPGVNDA